MIILDYSQLAISTLMVELRGQTGAKIDAGLVRHMILNALRSYNTKFRKDYGQLVIACDSRNYWRRDAFPNYKSGRKKARDASGFDWKAIFEALNQVKSELKEFGPYPIIEIDRAEADDVIGSLVFWTQKNGLEVSAGLFSDPESQRVLILSGDHDFEQLQRYSNIKQYSPILKKWIKIREHPDHVLMEHILLGDKGDGVPNFLSGDNVFVDGERQKPIRKTHLALWKTQSPDSWVVGSPHEDNFRRNERMIDLRFIPKDIQESIIHSYEEQKNTRDKSKLLNYFIAFKLRNMIELITEF